MNTRRSGIVYAVVAAAWFGASAPGLAADGFVSGATYHSAPSIAQIVLVAGRGPEVQELIEKYPYPDKAFVLTPEIWERTVKKIESGNPDWFDAEIVRQRAEIEGHEVSMELLAWMYERGRGVKQDFRQAFLWYSRAEIAGVKRIRGDLKKIFNESMTKKQRQSARRTLRDEFEKAQTKRDPGWERIRTQILAPK